MKVTVRQHQHHLLDRIISALESDRRLNDDIIAYINATLFSPEPEPLAAFLNADTDSERDSLLDLIFFPDQAVQIDLEALLETARFSLDDEKQLGGQLMARKIHARIGMPDGRHLTRIQVPDFIKARYLERLKIAWHMERDLVAAIAEGVSDALAPMVKVRLRNAGLRIAPHQRVFLGRFFQRMVDSDPDYLDCLDLVISILDKAKTHIAVYDLLVDRKRSFFRGLQQAKRFEAALRQSNMETLMLMGVRAPHVSPDTLWRQMRLIALICFKVFGKTEAIDMPLEEPLREIRDLENPVAAVRSLLR